MNAHERWTTLDMSSVVGNAPGKPEQVFEVGRRSDLRFCSIQLKRGTVFAREGRTQRWTCPALSSVVARLSERPFDGIGTQRFWREYPATPPDHDTAPSAEEEPTK